MVTQSFDVGVDPVTVLTLANTMWWRGAMEGRSVGSGVSDVGERWGVVGSETWGWRS